MLAGCYPRVSRNGSNSHIPSMLILVFLKNKVHGWEVLLQVPTGLTPSRFPGDTMMTSTTAMRCKSDAYILLCVIQVVPFHSTYTGAGKLNSCCKCYLDD